MNPPDASADAEDRRFYAAFVSGALAPRDFRHREHLRLAYLCLTAEPQAAAVITFRRLLQAFLACHRIDPGKYHETLTCAWLQVVALHLAGAHAASFADFIADRPALLGANLMFAHYSRERLTSASAREQFIKPDLQPIAPAAAAG